MVEARAVGGIEVTPYTPVCCEPGFSLANSITHNLVSDTPEPGSCGLMATGLAALLATQSRRNQRSYSIKRYELLERALSTRTTVPTPKPRDFAICRNDRPW